MPQPIPPKGYKHLQTSISLRSREESTNQLGEERQKNSAFNLLDPSRIESRLLLSSRDNSEKLSKEEFEGSSKNENALIQIEDAQRQSFLSVSIFINPTTKENELVEATIEEEGLISQSVDFKQVEISKSPQKQEKGRQLKKNLIKQKQLKKSNAIKNFANNFVKEMKTNGSFGDLRQKHKIDKKSFKNIMDNLNKKIVYERRCQKMEDIISMINHSSKNYSLFLLEACQNFIKNYPAIVMRSEKLTDKQTNLLMVQKLQEKIQQHKLDQIE